MHQFVAKQLARAALFRSARPPTSLMEMEFWGVEVKSGQPLKVSPGEGMVLHLSQACLGELKKEKANDSVYLYVDVEGGKLVLGTLFVEKLPQQQFDLVFDKDFEISHNSKGSVYFYGYLASNPYDDEEPGDIVLRIGLLKFGKVLLIRELKCNANWVNSLSLSTDFILRTGAFDHTGKQYSSAEEINKVSLERYS